MNTHIRFKINSVINRFNYEEDMTGHLRELKPFRWKVFQVLLIENENGSAYYSNLNISSSEISAVSEMPANFLFQMMSLKNF